MIDIHTHREKEGAIYNLNLAQLRNTPPYYNKEQWLSVGIHPWDITDYWVKDFDFVQAWASQPQVKAIGECGLDRLVLSPCQEEVFRAHILLSEEVQKPLIIHCVKAIDTVLSIRKELIPSQPWILHGFRGKPQQAIQLIEAGFFLSFGERFNVDSVRICPRERLCMETDDSKILFEEIEKRIKEARMEQEESFAKDLFLK